MLSDEWLSRYGLLENFNASVTRTGTGTGTHTGTGTWTTGVTAIALCTSCSRAKNGGRRTDDGQTMDGRTDDGAWVYYKLTL